jgi:hypothetical protein
MPLCYLFDQTGRYFHAISNQSWVGLCADQNQAGAEARLTMVPMCSAESDYLNREP